MRAEIIPSEPDPVNTGEGKRIPLFISAFFAAPLSQIFVAFFSGTNGHCCDCCCRWVDAFVKPDVMTEVSINQQTFQLPEQGTLADVLPLLRIAQGDGIAIAVNEVVIPRGEWATHVLRERDRVFVIRATQGG